MSVLLYVILGILAVLIIWQLAVWIYEINYKNRQIRMALSFTHKQHKPLLVAGGPWGGRSLRRLVKMPAHIMGDVSIDICRGAVEGHPNGIVATVTKLPFPDKIFGAALASHLLEHLNSSKEAKQALAELQRVADSVFIAYPTRQSLAAWIIPDHHLWVWQKGDTIFLKQRFHGLRQSSGESYKLDNAKES